MKQLSKALQIKLSKMILDKINEVYYFNTEQNPKRLNVGNGIYEQLDADDLIFDKISEGNYAILLPENELALLGNIHYPLITETTELDDGTKIDLKDAFIDIEVIGGINIPADQRQLILSIENNCIVYFGLNNAGEFYEIYEEAPNDLNYGVQIEDPVKDIDNITHDHLKHAVNFEKIETNEVYLIPKFKIDFPEDMFNED